MDLCYADYGLLENRAVEESPTSPSLENLLSGQISVTLNL